MNTNLMNIRSIAILFSSILLFVLVWLYLPQAYIASDPWAYSSRAYSIMENLDFGKGHVFDHRIGLTIPVAIIYKLFGISITTTNLIALLSVITIFITIWVALPDNKSRTIGLFLALTSVPLLKASSALFPDIVATAFMGISSLLLFNRHKYLSYRYWIIFPLGAMLFLFWAFLAKLSAYWVLPLWIIYIIKDLRSKDFLVFKYFYTPAILFGLILGTAYLYFSYITWGSALARLESVQSLTGVHLWAAEHMSTWDMFKRLTVLPIILFLKEYYIIPLLVLISPWVIPKQLWGWIFYLLFCVGFFWFGSTSFTQYEPMPLFDRMVLPALPAIYILAAYVIAKIDLSSSRLQFSSYSISIILVLALTVYPLARYAKSLQSKNLAESHVIEYLKNYTQKKSDQSYLLLCSDQRSAKYLKIYFSYKYPKNLKVLTLAQIYDTSDNLIMDHKVLIYTDEDRSKFLYSAYKKKNYDAEIKALNLNQLTMENSISLYEVSTISEKLKLIGINKKLDDANETNSTSGL